MCTLRRILLAASAALLLTTAVPARAETTAQASARLGTILGRAGITGTNQTYVLTLLPLFANGGTFNMDEYSFTVGAVKAITASGASKSVAIQEWSQW